MIRLLLVNHQKWNKIKWPILPEEIHEQHSEQSHSYDINNLAEGELDSDLSTIFVNVAIVNRHEKSSTQIATNDSATHATNDTMRSLLPWASSHTNLLGEHYGRDDHSTFSSFFSTSKSRINAWNVLQPPPQWRNIALIFLFPMH